jgi:2'-5' RNA ligase
MRLFLGIELSDAARTAAASVAKALESRIARAAPRSSIRWVDAANLHITLWFLGEVQDADAARLVDVLEPSLPVQPFQAELHGFGTFPPAGAPRVIWVGIGGGRDPMVDIYEALSLRLVPLGHDREKRAYSPHLTIARVKDIHRRDTAVVRKALTDAKPISARFDVAFVTLFRSRLSRKGAQYESVLRVPLQ